MYEFFSILTMTRCAPKTIQKLGYDLHNVSQLSMDRFWPVSEKKHGLIRLDEAITQYGINDLANYTFIGVIRDPILRIISAYRDKIGRGSAKISRQYFWKLYGIDIIKRYRHISPPQREKQAIIKNLIPTFSEFIQYVIDEYPGKKLT